MQHPMLHAKIKNLPKDPKEIFDWALTKTFNSWIDEKDSIANPSAITRDTSILSYDEAYKIIKLAKPKWGVTFRNNSYFGQLDYWEFYGCNIALNDYGSVFIWIQVYPNEAEQIFEKFGLDVQYY